MSLKNKSEGAPSESMLIIETNLTIYSASNWMIDSESSVHLGTSLQGLKDSRRLREGEMIISIRNGAKITAVII